MSKYNYKEPLHVSIKKAIDLPEDPEKRARALEGQRHYIRHEFATEAAKHLEIEEKETDAGMMFRVEISVLPKRAFEMALAILTVTMNEINKGVASRDIAADSIRIALKYLAGEPIAQELATDEPDAGKAIIELPDNTEDPAYLDKLVEGLLPLFKGMEHYFHPEAYEKKIAEQCQSVYPGGLPPMQPFLEDSFVAFCHSQRSSGGIAMKLRNMLDLWNEQSPNHQYFRNRYGLTHADQMSDLVLRRIYTENRKRLYGK